MSAPLIAACALTLAACTPLADDHGTPNHNQHEEPRLPAGVVPPTGDPQPGEARLGPDGYYDYGAEDFVLENPCDGLPYELAKAQGFDYGPHLHPRTDEPDYTICRLIGADDGLPLASYRHNRRDFEALGYTVNLHEGDGRAWYTVVMPGLISELCFAGVDTVRGSVGAGYPIGGFSEYKTATSACNHASELFNTIFGGHNGYSGSPI